MLIEHSVRFKKDRIDVYKMFFEAGRKGEAGWSLAGYGERETFDEPDKFIEEKLSFSIPIEFISLSPETREFESGVAHVKSQGLCFQADDEMLKICVDILADKFLDYSINDRVSIAKLIFRAYKPYDKRTSEIFKNQIKLDNLLRLKETKYYSNIVEYIERKGKLAYEDEISFDFKHIIKCYLNNNYRLPNGYRFNIQDTCGDRTVPEVEMYNLRSSAYTSIWLQVVSPAGVVLNGENPEAVYEGEDPEAIYEKVIYFKPHMAEIGFKIDFKEIDEAINNEMPQIIAACKDFNTYYFVPRNYKYRLNVPVYKFNNTIRKVGLNKDSMDLIKESHKYIYNLLKKYNCIGVDYTFYNEVYYQKENKVYWDDYYDGISITVEFKILTNGEYGLKCKRKSFELDRIWVRKYKSRGVTGRTYRQSSNLDEFIKQEVVPICEEFKRDLYRDNATINPNNYIYKKVDEDFYKFLCDRYSNKNNACLPGEDEIKHALNVRSRLLKSANYDKEQRRLKEEQRRLQQLAEEHRLKEEAELQDKKIINRILKLFEIKK